MQKIFRCFLIGVLLLANTGLFAGDMKVGIGRKAITPQGDAWLNGYANPARLKPASGVAHDLWAKAIVFEESPASRVVIVTTDLLGLSHEISMDIAQKLNDKYGITRSQLLMNSSHTHSAPMIWPAAGMFDYKPDDMRTVYEYTRQLVADIIATVDMAMAGLAAMKVSSGHGIAEFGVNRRDPKLTIRPVDHDVPVLKIATADGVIKAVLFGYACHNTTLPGDYTEVNGDYSGYAQIELENMYPGITALFFQGCCGDINPDPRGRVEDAMQHGKSLAESVRKVLAGTLQPVNAPIRTRYETVELEFRAFDLKLYQNDMLQGDEYVQRRAKLMLQAYNKGWDVSHYNYPIQVIRFGKDLTILAFAGETVVDYALWAKKEYKKENLFVTGYSNEVMCYIPTKRILEEGGYEANSSMIYYVLPGPFADNVEEKIQGAVQRAMRDIGVSPSN